MEDRTLKKRNIAVLIFEIFVIIAGIGGVTFATSKLITGTSTKVTFGSYSVDFLGDTEINTSNLEPISDELINQDITDNVIRISFSLRGTKENKDKDLLYDIMLTDIDIDCSLMNEYTKWNLYQGDTLLSNGNFSPQFDTNIQTDNYHLTNIQEDLPQYNEEYDEYTLIIWISESCSDITTCSLIDQSNTINSNLSMTLFIAISGGEKVAYERTSSTDATCINKPVTSDEMIPVTYVNDDWVFADKTNQNEFYSWYNYSQGKWANIVFVTDYTKYANASYGTKISDEDILAFYVWIPRYKYQTFNNGIDYQDTYDAYNQGINILFESGTNTTGTATCTTITCDTNLYSTHPAFSDDLRGFWVSKYEINEDYGFTSNTNILLNNTLDKYQTIINNLSTSYNISDTFTSEIITNKQWGAIVYLSHSIYGVCLNNECSTIESNTSTISGTNQEDSTTGNTYGVYDMSGSAYEYVLGSNEIGTATIETRLSENESWYHTSYLDTAKKYALRGGSGITGVSDIGMYDTSTRAVLIAK